MTGVTSDMNMFSGITQNHVPQLAGSILQNAKMKHKDYHVRIARFEIDEESYSDIATLERLWSLGMDPDNKDIVILSNKEFTNLGSLIIVVTFLEHKKNTVSWKVDMTDEPFPTADELLAEVDKNTGK